MNDLLQPFLWRFILVIFEDILVYINNKEQHIIHFLEVLEALQTSKFFANKKCSFSQ